MKGTQVLHIHHQDQVGSINLFPLHPLRAVMAQVDAVRLHQFDKSRGCRAAIMVQKPALSTTSIGSPFASPKDADSARQRDCDRCSPGTASESGAARGSLHQSATPCAQVLRKVAPYRSASVCSSLRDLAVAAQTPIASSGSALLPVPDHRTRNGHAESGDQTSAGLAGRSHQLVRKRRLLRATATQDAKLPRQQVATAQPIGIVRLRGDRHSLHGQKQRPGKIDPQWSASASDPHSRPLISRNSGTPLGVLRNSHRHALVVERGQNRSDCATSFSS